VDVSGFVAGGGAAVTYDKRLVRPGARATVRPTDAVGNRAACITVQF
jgi:hypothetical protein